VDDRVDAAALVEVGAAEQTMTREPPTCSDRTAPAWPDTAGGRKPGSSVTGTSSSAGPRASAAGTQPDPMTRATSWRGTPVSSAQRRAASAARADGSGLEASDTPGTLPTGGRPCASPVLRPTFAPVWSE
jgi:hypothetical protein